MAKKLDIGDANECGASRLPLLVVIMSARQFLESQESQAFYRIRQFA